MRYAVKQHMKQTITLLSILIGISGLSFMEANSSGAPAGHSGSPASNGQTCARSGCHTGGGSPGANHEATFTSSIPSAGYEPGDTYTMILSVNDLNDMVSRVGFNLSIEDGNGNHVGTLNPLSGSKFSSGSTQFLTQQGSAISLPAVGRDYTFEWTAPTNPPQNIEVYAAVNFANGNGNTSGDIIKAVSTSFSLANSVGLNDESLEELSSIYPIPSNGLIRLDVVPTEASEWNIVDMRGVVVAEGEFHFTGTEYSWDLSDFSKGVYTFNMFDSNSAYMKQQRIILE